MMRALKLAGMLATGIGAVLALTGAQRPLVFAQTAPGEWEVSGIPGARSPLRQCFANVTVLAQFEHRERLCPHRILNDQPNSAVIDYSCGRLGFGHSKVDAITPRSLRIETQGVSNNLPFSYVLQARRVGDCPAVAAASRH
jgi:hypothetical protein